MSDQPIVHADGNGNWQGTYYPRTEIWMVPSNTGSIQGVM